MGLDPASYPDGIKPNYPPKFPDWNVDALALTPGGKSFVLAGRRHLFEEIEEELC